METALFLARAWGLYLFLVSLGFIVNKKSFLALLRTMKNDLGVFTLGSIVFGIGVAQVVAYNDWSTFWTGLITLFGWISLFKGAFILFVPGYMEKFAGVAVKEHWYMVSLVVGVLLGAYLLYVGYITY